MNIIIATIKSWNIDNAKSLFNKYGNAINFLLIDDLEKLTYENIKDFDPRYIFFPHWSSIIPENIYKNYECVVFHMADLPYGRGGSPLQNLIIRGHKNTKISAIKVIKDLDAGPIYFKNDLTLDGSATEIFKRASDIIFNKMIPRFFSENIIPYDQVGEPVIFKRRKLEESEIRNNMNCDDIYNHIRMLDAEGYPKAFIKIGNIRLEFSNAKIENNKVFANVVLIKEKNE